MATINYKEKYEKAVHAAMLAKQDTESAVTIRILEEIFPELKESEDERIRKDLISHFKETIDNIRSEEIIPRNAKILVGKMQKWIAWLEKQGETSHILSNSSNIGKDEQKPAWSEDDQSNFNELSSFIFETYRTEDASRLITWLKSLRPQNRWKPSDEQIKAVKEAACYSSVFSEKTIDNLISLSKQLMKLREE